MPREFVPPPRAAGLVLELIGTGRGAALPPNLSILARALTEAARAGVETVAAKSPGTC